MEREFLIKDYSEVTRGMLDNKDYSKLKLYIVDLRGMLDWLDKARMDSEVSISVFQLGDCLLDWS